MHWALLVGGTLPSGMSLVCHSAWVGGACQVTFPWMLGLRFRVRTLALWSMSPHPIMSFNVITDQRMSTQSSLAESWYIKHEIKMTVDYTTYSTMLYVYVSILRFSFWDCLNLSQIHWIRHIPSKSPMNPLKLSLDMFLRLWNNRDSFHVRTSLLG